MTAFNTLLAFGSLLVTLFSLGITLFLEWDRLRKRLSALRSDPQRQLAESAPPSSQSTTGALAKTLISVLGASLTLLFVNFLVLYSVFGKQPPGCVPLLWLLASTVGGFAWGYRLRNQTWIRIFVFVGIPSLLFVGMCAAVAASA